MALKYVGFVAIVALGFLWAPLLADGGACDDYNCIQGDCVEVSGFPPVKCVCKDGWSNILGMSALSCAIPKCDFNMSCAKTNKADDASHDNSPSFDIFNPCSYKVCGEGDCIKQNGNNSYTCRCYEGYGNLLNSPSGICVADCSIGADCNQLGINLGPSSSPSSPGSNSSSTLSDTNAGAMLLEHFEKNTENSQGGGVIIVEPPEGDGGNDEEEPVEIGTVGLSGLDGGDGGGAAAVGGGGDRGGGDGGAACEDEPNGGRGLRCSTGPGWTGDWSFGFGSTC
ncbi:hypothetical protein SELMODRAFT_440224 [Selaginella moellendorffii]|uniref:EGF-like domain-containing protein n=1 Tax=Selaginella moellendorffii TaxID=88036 RepID=D8R9B2_SELML|nr:hypothetical protein SELMODRAFT_440224 [Selaginella moellendorffii]